MGTTKGSILDKKVQFLTPWSKTLSHNFLNFFRVTADYKCMQNNKNTSKNDKSNFDRHISIECEKYCYPFLLMMYHFCSRWTIKKNVWNHRKRFIHAKFQLQRFYTCCVHVLMVECDLSFSLIIIVLFICKLKLDKKEKRLKSQKRWKL